MCVCLSKLFTALRNSLSDSCIRYTSNLVRMEPYLQLPASEIVLLIGELESTREVDRLHIVSSEKVWKWSKGRWYCVQDDVFIIIHSNFPNVNYLNLEEYACYHYRKESVSPKFFLDEVERRDPLLLDYSGENFEHFLKNLSWNLTDIMLEQSETMTKMIEEEYRYVAMMSLLRQWDARKFQRFVDYRLRTHFNDFRSYGNCDLYLVLVLVFSADSTFVVDFFRKICTRFLDDTDERFFPVLPVECILFFAQHLVKTDYSSTAQERWLASEDLLVTGLKRKKVEIVRLALAMNCPSALLPSGVPEEFSPLPAELLWPKEKDGINATSFNSLEYHIVFTNRLVSITLESAQVERIHNQELLLSDMADCFHLIWRAIPVPYLPFQDMQSSIILMRIAHDNGEPLPGNEQWHRQMETLWRFFYKFFEEDFPHEYKPRPLKHLTRYAIRRRCSLPERIEHLPLPESLKRYVKLEF